MWPEVVPQRYLSGSQTRSSRLTGLNALGGKSGAQWNRPVLKNREPKCLKQ